MNPIDNKNGQDQHEPDYSGKGKDVLVREGAGSSDPHVRGYALFMLGELKDPELLRYYVDRLRDPDKAVRAQAAAALKYPGAREAVNGLAAAESPFANWVAASTIAI